MWRHGRPATLIHSLPGFQPGLVAKSVLETTIGIEDVKVVH